MIRDLLRRLGLDVVAYEPRNYPHLRRHVLVRELGIGLVLDAGGSDGGWAALLRAKGYSGRIESFEPHGASFAELERRSAADPLWTARRVALAEAPGEVELHVAANRKASTVMPMLDGYRAVAPGLQEVATERVEAARLDDLVAEIEAPAFLKVDVEGYELPVLRGAERVLAGVRLVEIELTPAPLYEGQALMPEVLQFLADRGFQLVGLETSFRDRRTGDLLQANGILRRP